MQSIKRNILLNPGPATTTDTVKMAQVVPDICPREKEFGDILNQIQKDLVRIVNGNIKEYTTVLFCGSGTINMDICLNSLLPKNKKILIINNGAYSARAVEICQHYNLPLVEIKFLLNERPSLATIEETLQKNTDIHLVYATHNETGTGLLNPIREIGILAHRYNRVFVVDTTSTYAMLPIDMEKDNIDFCMASAQKGLMAMAGLSFVVGKTKLIEESKVFPKRSYYCNLYLQYEYFIKTGQMHFTPPVQTVYAARQAIDEFFKEGEDEKYARHSRVNEAIHNGLKELGFKEFIKKEIQSGLIVSAIYPDDKNWNFEKIHDYCYERGFTIYPGKVSDINTFRLCSFGAIDVPDIEDFFAVFKKSLEHYNIAVPVKYNEAQ
jgi:2-aminoethylphosphonate-pyruvate transaminase